MPRILPIAPTLAVAVVVALLVGLTGCDRDEITSYAAPKDPPRPTPVQPALPDAAPTAPALAWDVPDHWRPAAQPPDFVLVAYDAGEGDQTVQTTVSRLAGTGGGALPNINRWRRQLDLPPVADLSDQPITPLNIRDDVAAMVDLSSPQGRTIAVMFPRPDQDETWFFKLTGPVDAVEAQKQPFIDLVQSARPAAPAQETAQ